MSTARGRGGGSGSKKTFKPNLAVAGKRETPVPSETSQRGNSERGRGRGRGGDRGGRGRGARGGRGRGGAADRPALIQSEGIFSSGLNDDRAAGRSAAAAEAGDSFRVGRSRVKTEQISSTSERLDGRTTATYGDEWLTDDDVEDEKALDQLFQVGFISDLRVGDQRPLALPLSDAHIFDEDNADKKPTKLHMEDSKEAVREQIKKQRRNQRRIESESPTPEPLARGGQIGQAFDELSRKNKSINEPADFVFIQLPDTLSDMLVQSGKLVKKEPATAEESMEINVDGEDAPSTSVDSKIDEESKRRHCLDAFVHGAKLGRVQILKSGKARLIMGNMTLDLHLATHVDCLQEIVSIETPPAAAPGQSAESGRMCVLGAVKQRMTASQDIESLVAAYRR